MGRVGWYCLRSSGQESHARGELVRHAILPTSGQMDCPVGRVGATDYNSLYIKQTICKMIIIIRI